MARFPSPFEKAFAYGNAAINLENPIVKALICLAARSIAAETQTSCPPMQRKQIQYALRTVFLDLPGGVSGKTYEEWKNLTVDL